MAQKSDLEALKADMQLLIEAQAAKFLSEAQAREEKAAKFRSEAAKFHSEAAKFRSEAQAREVKAAKFRNDMEVELNFVKLDISDLSNFADEAVAYIEVTSKAYTELVKTTTKGEVVTAVSKSLLTLYKSKYTILNEELYEEKSVRHIHELIPYISNPRLISNDALPLSWVKKISAALKKLSDEGNNQNHSILSEYDGILTDVIKKVAEVATYEDSRNKGELKNLLKINSNFFFES